MSKHQSMYRNLLQERQLRYNEALASGKHTPFIYPYDSLPAAYLIIGVLLSPRVSPRLQPWFRRSLCILSLAHSYERWTQSRMLGAASGYGLGIAASWGMIMSGILLLLHDPAKDYTRLETRLVSTHGQRQANGHNTVSDHDDVNIDIRRRRVYGMNTKLDPVPVTSNQTTSKAYYLVWQGYPSEFLHALDWTVDLVTSFRGINWNFRIPTVPKLDVPYPGEFSDGKNKAKAESQRSIPTAVPQTAMTQLRSQAIRDFVFYYLMLDFLKCIMVVDPYFLGIADIYSPPPWAWLENLNLFLPFAVKAYRLGVSMCGVIAALTFIFSLAPLFYGVLLPVMFGDKIFSLTKSPLLEPGMYANQWGPTFKSLSEKGLGGFWGSWWHQMFRHGISEPSKVLLQRFGIDRKGALGRAIQLFIAFGLTGFIHAAASSTTFSIVKSKPWHPWVFFVLQAPGIIIQTSASAWLNKLLRPSKLLRKIGNISFIVFWAYLVGELLAGDFARCGIWLFEPVPISPLRGFGFGPGDTWFPWLKIPEGAQWVRWWHSEKWYLNGLAVY